MTATANSNADSFYAAPNPAVPGVASPQAGPPSFERLRVSAVLVFFLNTFTSGLYGLYWYRSRARAIDERAAFPFAVQSANRLIAATVTLIVSKALAPVLGEVSLLIPLLLLLLVVAAALISFVSMVTYLFRSLNVLRQASAGRHGMGFGGAIATFLFGPAYLQALINRVAADERAGR